MSSTPRHSEAQWVLRPFGNPIFHVECVVVIYDGPLTGILMTENQSGSEN